MADDELGDIEQQIINSLTGGHTSFSFSIPGDEKHVAKIQLVQSHNQEPLSLFFSYQEKDGGAEISRDSGQHLLTAAHDGKLDELLNRHYQHVKGSSRQCLEETLNHLGGMIDIPVPENGIVFDTGDITAPLNGNFQDKQKAASVIAKSIALYIQTIDGKSATQFYDPDEQRAVDDIAKYLYANRDVIGNAISEGQLEGISAQVHQLAKGPQQGR